MKEELKQFDIDIDTIKPTNEFYNNLQDAIEELRKYTLKDRFEVVLNNNLIKCKENKTNFRTILGCRVSYDNLDRNISFIVREDTKPTYEELEERINKAIKYIEENSLYEQDYDYDYEENLVEYPPSDEQAKKDLLNILKGDNEK